MKKYILVFSLIVTLAMCSCGKQKTQNEENVAQDTPAPTISDNVINNVAGDNKEQETVEITDQGLKEKISSVNKEAKASTATNHGSKLLSIDLPIKNDNKVDEFIKQVEKIGNSIDIKNNKSYQFFHFTTSQDNQISIVMSFKNDGEKLALDSFSAIDKSYESDVEKNITKAENLFSK